MSQPCHRVPQGKILHRPPNASMHPLLTCNHRWHQRNGVKMWSKEGYKLMIQPSFLGRNLIFKVPIAKSPTTMSPAAMKLIITIVFYLVRCPAQVHYHCQRYYHTNLVARGRRRILATSLREVTRRQATKLYAFFVGVYWMNWKSNIPYINN